ncbi:hypothetical protein HID58_018189, partial [Brassica napus]
GPPRQIPPKKFRSSGVNTCLPTIHFLLHTLRIESVVTVLSIRVLQPGKEFRRRYVTRMSNSSLLLGDLKAAGVDVRLLRLCRLTDVKKAGEEKTHYQLRRGHKTTIVNGIRETVKEYNSVHVFSFKNMKTIKFKEFIQQFRHHGSSTSDEVHHAIFKASKLLHGDDELLMPKEETAVKGLNCIHLSPAFHVELKGGLLERFTHEMEPFLRKQGMHVRLNKRCILPLLVSLLHKVQPDIDCYSQMYPNQKYVCDHGKLETETVPDKACNGTSILDSSEESKMGLDVRMCNGNGLLSQYIRIFNDFTKLLRNTNKTLVDQI